MSDSNQLSTVALQQLAEVKGQLANITLLIQISQSSTHQRIDDLRQAMEGRFEGIEQRLASVEANERSTAVKASAVGAVSSAVVTAVVQLLKG